MINRSDTYDTLSGLVVALCLDYRRRQRLIESGELSFRTASELRYLNIKLIAAANEIVGEELSELFIREIGERKGYATSAITDMSEYNYKMKKRQVVDNIIKKLHLG